MTPQSGAFTRIAYTLSMPRPTTHLFEVSIALETPAGTVPAVRRPADATVAARPILECRFRKERSGVLRKARGLSICRLKRSTARRGVSRHAAIGRSTCAYKVFGNDLSGTYAQLDGTHGNFNGGEIFMYVVGHKQDAVELAHPAASGMARDQRAVGDGWIRRSGNIRTTRC